ncbi:hypothetical protein [uncultured Litoreibacter sp.]|uniref:esterase/lipase family protein n=1 Tax=uncultured Litoreibacter sp. TaxID=1392394 RepID=UPI002625961C|nr:hypothetical protein [uncultured Litoreibacter sp.]
MADGATQSCPGPLVLPVIFVPGIMGSRLRAGNDSRWDPPHSAPQDGNMARDRSRATDPEIPEEEWRLTLPNIGRGDPTEQSTRDRFVQDEQLRSAGKAAGAVATWGRLDGAERRQRMIGNPGQPFRQNFLTVDPGNAAHFEGRMAPNLIPMAVDRGWGGLVWEFYGGFMRWLHYFAAMEIELPAACASLKVEAWACPYNWTGDNADAAALLDRTVSRAVQEANTEHTPRGATVLDPIVLTHSMGGLVGRAWAANNGGNGKAHSIIHGAMPTHGSPAAYKRMRAGFEGLGAVVLGLNAAEVTALLANMPGGLELLPNQFHKDRAGGTKWLEVTGSGGQKLEELPNGDPYSEIYLNQTDWWKLVDAALVDPEGNNPGRGFGFFTNNLAKAKAFHTNLGDTRFHPNTKMFYSDAGGAFRCWDRVEWRCTEGSVTSAAALSALPTNMVADNGTGRYAFQGTEPGRLWGTNTVDIAAFEIQGPNANGDATVHTGSGIHVPGTVESEASRNGYAHDQAYNDASARQQVSGWIAEMIAAMV